MNKTALLTVGKRLMGETLYLVSINDLEPSGVLIQAYNQADSKEYLLGVSERELFAAGFNRSTESLNALIDTLKLVPQSSGCIFLVSNSEHISKPKQVLEPFDTEALLNAPMTGGESIKSLIVKGLVELCKSKPVGLEAVSFLGEWLIANNPSNPVVDEP